MDIAYLLWLQRIREIAGSFVTWMFCMISEIPVGFTALLVSSLFYWVLDQDTGLYLMSNFGLGRALNLVLKNTACIFRPWVRDARVIPAADALPGATGYSFPSGHTQRAVSLYGGVAVRYRKKYTLLSVLCVAVALVVGFSRNFLGVHTPQDVICAALESILMLFLTSRLFQWVRKHPEQIRFVFAGGVLLTVFMMVYVLLKPYPSGIVNGEMAADPVVMKHDVFDAAGYMLSFFGGWALDHYLIHLKAPATRKNGILRFVIGAVILTVLVEGLLPAAKAVLDVRVYKFLNGFLPFLFILGVIPLVFKIWERDERQNSGIKKV